MAKNSQIIWGMLGAGALVAMIFLGLMFSGALSTIGEDTGDGTTTTGDCNTAPTLNVPVRDYFNQGTSVDAGVTYRVNGALYDTKPDIGAGDEVEVKVNKSSYIDALGGAETIKCGANTIEVLMKPYSQPTLTLKDDSLNTLSDDASDSASTSISAISAGATETLTARFQGTNDATSGEMIYVVETSENADSITMSTGGSTVEKVDTPETYSETLNNPEVQAFKLEALDDAVQKDYSVSITADDNGISNTSIYTTAFVGEAYTEADGTFQSFGVEDSDDNTVYEATFDYDAHISG